MTPLDYPYLLFSGMNASIWLLFYFLRPALRRKMWFSSVVAGVLGLTEACFIPAYWNPAFPRIPLFTYRVDLEGILFSFFLGGMASVGYEALFRKQCFDAALVSARVLIALPCIFFLYPLVPQINVMYFCVASLLLCAFWVYRTDRRLGMPMLASGTLLLGYAVPTYLFLWHAYPTVPISYRYAELSGIQFRGILIEELLFFFSFGTVWCVFYDLARMSWIKRARHGSVWSPARLATGLLPTNALEVGARAGGRGIARSGGRWLQIIAMLGVVVLPGHSRGEAESAGLTPGVVPRLTTPTAGSDVLPWVWTPALAAYALDPRRGAGRLLAVGRQGATDLPGPVLLALGDAALRRGRLAAAERTLGEAQAAGSPWVELAALGLGSIRLARNDISGARTYFAQAEALPTDTGKLAVFLTALLDAAGGASGDAVEQLEALTRDGTAAVELLLAARLGIGYAYYWGGRYPEATAAFERAARELAETPLADDARYGAARARYESGDVAGALAAFATLATTRPPSPRGLTGTALVDLAPRAILRTGFRALRRMPGPLRAPEKQVIELLDRDGGVLARAALRRFEAESSSAPAIHDDPALAALPRAAGNTGSDRSRTAPVAAAHEREAHRFSVSALLVAAALLGALAGGAIMIRRGSGSVGRPRARVSA